MTVGDNPRILEDASSHGGRTEATDQDRPPHRAATDLNSPEAVTPALARRTSFNAFAYTHVELICKEKHLNDAAFSNHTPMMHRRMVRERFPLFFTNVSQCVSHLMS